MTRAQIFEQIRKKRSCLCVGLDTDPLKIPAHLRALEDPIFEFNKQIIDATHRYCVAYKPNVAFYEALGPSGWESLQKTLNYIPKDIFTIADAKRGDIGNTSALYAKAFFQQMNFDSVTIAPYMGEDSVTPFLMDGKWAILLAHTSNAGSNDFQTIQTISGRTVYEEVIIRAQKWASPDQLMFVVGATHPEKIANIRALAPDNFFLVPGVGAQGGDLEQVIRHGANASCGLLINASRSILYASSDKAFAKSAADEAQQLQLQMEHHLASIL